ncbi:MAG: AAA family ATPase [Bacteroidetes bacterium]|nr:AAA family ATPase [Bacteroidota bacterium]
MGNPVSRHLPPVALAISGRIASGKSSLAQGLASTLRWKQASFGDYVRFVAIERGMEPTRANLQTIGAQLVDEDPTGFVSAVLQHAGWIKEEPIIIDGLRHIVILETLRQLLSPLSLKLILVTVGDDVRGERLKSRSDGLAECLQVVEAHSTEQDVRGDLLAFADLSVDGSKPLNQLVVEVVEWVSGLTTCDR